MHKFTLKWKLYISYVMRKFTLKWKLYISYVVSVTRAQFSVSPVPQSSPTVQSRVQSTE